MGVVTTMAVVGLGLKLIIAGCSVVGVASGINWLNKKTITFGSKKGGVNIESEIDSEKFNRHHL